MTCWRGHMLIAGAALILTPCNLHAQTDHAAAIALPASPLAEALRNLAIQSRVGILFNPDLVAGLHSAKLSGTMSVEQALQRLLAGTGLTYRRTTGGAFIIRAGRHARQPRQQAGDTVSLAEDIIVNGARRIGAIKQDSDIQIAVITELETKRLPTLDVSDMLIRLPGVRRNDTQSGENRYVSILGMNNAAASQSIDGVLLTNYIARTRATSTEALTAAFFKRTEVSVTSTPDLDENSNSANVALSTISGLDGSGEHLLDLRVLGGTDSRSGGLRSTLQPLWVSATWRGALDQEGTLGLALGAGLDRLGSRQDAISFAGYKTAGGALVPDGALTRGQTYTRTERISAMARLDARPTDRLSLFTEYFFVSHSFTTDQLTSSASVSAQNVQAPSGTSGQFGNATVIDSFNYQAGPMVRTHLIQLGADYQSSTSGLLSFRFGATRNQVKQLGISPGGFTAASSALNTPIGYTYSGSALSLSPGSSASLANPANYALSGTTKLSDFIDTDHNYFARADYIANAAIKDHGWGIKLGAQLKTLDVHEVQLGYSRQLAPGQSISLADVVQGGSVTPLVPVAIDSGKLLDLLAQRGVASPDPNGLYPSDPADGYGQNFSGAEQIVDLYGIATYGFARGRLSAGLRAAHTRRTLNVWEPDASGIWSPAHYEQAYWDLLPSVYGHFDLSNGVRLRGAVSRTMERPGINTSAKHTLISYDTPVTRTISYTDPYLKPIRSDNAELSAEYVYGPDNSFVTIGVFAKNLHDISAVSTSQSTGADGVVNIISFTTNVNAVNGKKVFGRMRGADIVWSDPRLSFFPARWGTLGLTLSYSYIVYQNTVLNGGVGIVATDTRLVDVAPRHYFNAALYYRLGDFSANAFVQKQSSMPVLTYNPANDRRTSYGAFVSAQVTYALTSNVRLMMEGSNLTDQKIVDRYGVTGYGPAYQIRRNGRTVWGGVQLTFY